MEVTCDRPLDDRPVLQLNRNRLIVQFHQKSGQTVRLALVLPKIVMGYEPDELHGGIPGSGVTQIVTSVTKIALILSSWDSRLDVERMAKSL